MDTTICVLSYNSIEITKIFIDLLFQHTNNFKLIMIDNGSSDGTPEFLSKFIEESKLKYAKEFEVFLALNNENLGVIGGRNLGFELYKNNPTDYLCFLDNDQLVQYGWLEQHKSFMLDNKFDIVGVDAWLMDKKFMPRYNCKKLKEPFTYVGCGGMLIKKLAVDIVGSFDSQFNPAYFEDPDYNFRAIKNGLRIGYNYEAKINHVPHQTLGKNADKSKIFKNSYNKFCVKWSGYTPITMR